MKTQKYLNIVTNTMYLLEHILTSNMLSLGTKYHNHQDRLAIDYLIIRYRERLHLKGWHLNGYVLLSNAFNDNCLPG